MSAYCQKDKIRETPIWRTFTLDKRINSIPILSVFLDIGIKNIIPKRCTYVCRCSQVFYEHYNLDHTKQSHTKICKYVCTHVNKCLFACLLTFFPFYACTTDDQYDDKTLITLDQ